MDLDLYQRVQTVANGVKFLDWRIEIWNTDPAFVLIRVAFDAPDVNHPVIATQYGRWWVIQEDADRNDILRTVHKAVECAWLHEMNEQFYYRGERVFDPHKRVIC